MISNYGIVVLVIWVLETCAGSSSETMVTGFPEGIKNYEWRHVRKALCQTCVIAKQTQLPYRTSASLCTRPLQSVQMYVCGPMLKVAMNGERYFVTMLDDHSKFATVRVCKSKADCFACVTSTLTYYKLKVVLLCKESGWIVVRSFLTFLILLGTWHNP
jgi:hypothetical protein